MPNPNPDPPPPDPDLITQRAIHAAREEINKTLIQHLKLCPFFAQDVETRLRNVEINYAKLVGFMAGSGVLGGAASGLIIKLLGP